MCPCLKLQRVHRALSSSIMARGGYNVDEVVSGDLAVRLGQVLCEMQSMESDPVRISQINPAPVEWALIKQGFMRDNTSSSINRVRLNQLLKLDDDMNIHQSMALLCFHVMTTALRFNIADITTAFRNREIPDLEHRIKTNISHFSDTVVDLGHSMPRCRFTMILWSLR